MMRYCFLDMDGVLADFVKGACLFHGKDDPALCRYEFWRDWGMPDAQFWEPMEFDFWAGLPLCEDALLIYEPAISLYGAENVYILTSPSRNAGCVTGKEEWVRRHIPALAEQMIFTPHKHLLAGRDRILYDDSPQHCQNFAAAGGNAVLVDRPWNRDAGVPEGVLTRWRPPNG